MRNRMPAPNTEHTLDDAWYQQPVVWLGALLFVASLAGCVHMIVLGVRHADQALPIVGGEIMHMPLARPAPTNDPPLVAP